MLFCIGGYALTALAGIGLFVWWFLTFKTGIFDFYQAYIVGISAGLVLFGAVSAIKSLITLKNSEKLATAAAKHIDKNLQNTKNTAMAMAFKFYMGAMIIALIFIGQAVNYTSFVVCLFSTIFAYLCYVGCSLIVGKR